MKNRLNKLSSLVLSLVLIVCLTGCGNGAGSAGAPATSPDYPERPVTVIVSFAAGGGTDLGTRILLNYAEPHFGQSFTVTNIDGGGSEVGVTQLKNSPNDGYTIGGFNSASIMLTSQREAQYDPVEDFEPICLQINDPRLFAVRADDDRFDTLEEFIEYAREHPGELTIGTSGAGTTGHFSIEALNYYAGVEVMPVHFGGAGESKAGFLGEHVDGIAQTVGEVTQMVEEGKAKVIGILAEERFEQFPDAQTFKEVGIDLVMNSARGYVAPKGTDRAVIDAIAEAFYQATLDPDYQQELDNMGLPSAYLGPDEYREFIREEKASFDELCAIIELEG